MADTSDMRSRKKPTPTSPAATFSAERVQQLHVLEDDLDAATQDAHALNQRVREQLSEATADQLLDPLAKRPTTD